MMLFRLKTDIVGNRERLKDDIRERGNCCYPLQQHMSIASGYRNISAVPSLCYSLRQSSYQKDLLHGRNSCSTTLPLPINSIMFISFHMMYLGCTTQGFLEHHINLVQKILSYCLLEHLYWIQSLYERFGDNDGHNYKIVCGQPYICHSPVQTRNDGSSCVNITKHNLRYLQYLQNRRPVSAEITNLQGQHISSLPPVYTNCIVKSSKFAAVAATGVLHQCLHLRAHPVAELLLYKFGQQSAQHINISQSKLCFPPLKGPCLQITTSTGPDSSLLIEAKDSSSSPPFLANSRKENKQNKPKHLDGSTHHCILLIVFIMASINIYDHSTAIPESSPNHLAHSDIA